MLNFNRVVRFLVAVAKTVRIKFVTIKPDKTDYKCRIPIFWKIIR